MVAKTNPAQQRQQAVVSALLPIVRIADQPTSWPIDDRLAHYGCPGTSIAAMQDGRIDWVSGFGLSETGTTASCGPDTIFMVASCSKPVTAMMVLQQVERGVLSLDSDVNGYLRRWKVPHNDFTASTPVTLRHILSHSAGLTVNGFGVVPRDGRPVPTLLDLLEGRSPSKEATVVVNKAYDGTDRYSGGGFIIAQMVLEDVLGRPFAEIADEFVLAPLGMARSTFRHPLPEEFQFDVASGHGDDAQPAAGGWMISAECGAGGLFSTARDYATFLLGARDAYLGEPDAILGRSLATEMLTRHDRGSFGLGFRVLGKGNTLRINHGGSNDGYQSETDCYLESGDGGVVLTNATSGLFLFREVLNSLADVYGWPGFMPAPKHLRHLTAAELGKYAGSFRIVSGLELPLLRTWVEDGRLLSQIPGLRFGVQETFCDTNGVLFNQSGPFETHVTFGADGLAEQLHVSEGDVQILHAVRVDE